MIEAIKRFFAGTGRQQGVSAQPEVPEEKEYLYEVIRRRGTVGTTEEEIRRNAPYLRWGYDALRDGWQFCPGSRNSPTVCELMRWPGDFAHIDLDAYDGLGAHIDVSGTDDNREMIRDNPLYPPSFMNRR